MIEPGEYVRRRRDLIREVGSGCILLLGNDLVGMNYKSNTYGFRQDGSMLYFGGVNEPGFALWLDCDTGQEFLCGPEPDMAHTIWSGPAPSVAEHAAQVGVVGHGSREDLALLAKKALTVGRAVHYLPPYRGDGELWLATLLDLASHQARERASLVLIRAVVRQRSVKSSVEADEIRAAVRVSAGMYAELMRQCRPGVTEMELYGRLQGYLLACGSQDAFPMILSRRGEVLHNHAHNLMLAQGNMLLVDSGAVSPLGYASDITRTIPVAGEFTSLQRDLYEIVLTAQAAALATMRPGIRFLDCHLAAARRLAEGLCALGIMRGNVDEAVHCGAHALFMPHGLGHMLGLDVHDMEGLGEDHVGYDREFTRSGQFGLSGLRMARRLEPGFVLTVEPGLYFIPALVRQWQKEKRHAAFIRYESLAPFLHCGGIRIEDDVLVTADGIEVLSAMIPKTPEEITAAMRLG